MSFASLAKQFRTQGKIVLKGGQCNGRVEDNDPLASRPKDETPKGKGAEYAARYRKVYQLERRGEEGKNVGRVDVTSGERSQMEELEELTSIGTVPNLRELEREDLTQVYRRYKFDSVEPSEQLELITSKKEEILNLIEGNGVCIISGPTGCGKSTQIPQFILDWHASQLKHCNIVVTQPRRIAAISLAQRVCAERGWGPPGRIVGYQVGLDKMADEDTRLLYCTTGVLLEKLINTQHLNNFTHILLDEVHEREEDMDLLMLLVKKFLATNSQNVKVILMSATMDVKKFANYFKIILNQKAHPAPSLEIETKTKYTVQTYYLESLQLMKPEEAEKLYESSKPEIAEAVYKMIPVMIRSFNSIDAEDYRCKRSNEKKGAVLIFLPGIHQIETLHEILSREDERQRANENPDFLNMWLCPLHSSITKDEQEKVVSYAPEGMRKVILSTNIAESSLTIPDVKYVIDFCLTKNLVANLETGFTSLQMAWASHTNCDQRKGRVGRVQHGRVYRMVSKVFYQFSMPKSSIPELCRCPLENVVLKCKRLCQDESPLTLISHALDPPDLDSYEKTILKLKEVGALLTTCNGVVDPEDGDLTFMGEIMSRLPVDIHISKLILLGHLLDVLEDVIIMGCAMSVRNIFSEHFGRKLEAYNNKLLWADQSESDAVSYLNVYTVWRQQTAMGKFQRSRGSEAGWGKHHMLQVKHLREVSILEDEIKRRLKHYNIVTARPNNKLWSKNEKPTILKLALAGAFYPNYYSCNAQNPNAEIEAIKELSGKNPNNCVYLQNMAQPAPIYFDQIKKIFHETQVSDNIKKLHFDTSQKLIVEFNQTSMSMQDVGSKHLVGDIPGGILMPVYRAVKLRQLVTGLSIRTLGSSEAKEKLNSLIMSSRMSNLGLETQSSEYKPLIPWDQQIVELAVCHVEDAGHFYGQLCPSTKEKLIEIHSLLNNGRYLCKLSGQIEPGATYAAPFKDEGDACPSYYRAKITRIQHRNQQPWVDVFFIDYGNSATAMPAYELREIISEEVQKELDSIPPQAVKCVLANVGPSLMNNKGGLWSEEATQFVKEKLMSPNVDYWTTQIYSFVNGVASVILFLSEEGTNERLPPSLNEELIKLGFAKPKEETYLSKSNHMKRKEIALQEQPLTNIESLRVLETTYKDLLSLPIGNTGKTQMLKGPYSPLEMKLYSKIKSSCQKEVKVEWNSVNSVLLDSEPNEPYEKLLVAAHVAQSATGNRLTLNHTTVMPNWNGLAALICLLFAPNVELRSDEGRSRYIGAVCGLGFDPETDKSYYPENDMEIKFDVEIKEHDLALINSFRDCMNARFCGRDSEDMPDQLCISLQQNVKKFLVELLSTNRLPVKVEHFQYSHRWNCVSDVYLKAPDRGDKTEFDQGVYQLINAIDLNPKGDFHYIQDLLKNFKILSECLRKDTPPKELKCHLCDVYYPYWKTLRVHVESGHHRQLTRWLRKRAEAHGLVNKDNLSVFTNRRT